MPYTSKTDDWKIGTTMVNIMFIKLGPAQTLENPVDHEGYPWVLYMVVQDFLHQQYD